MGEKRKDVMKLVRAIPATLGVKDHAAKRCIDAMKEVIENLLVELYGKAGEQVKTATPAGIAELEAGPNISIEKKAGNIRRVSGLNPGISWEDAIAAAQQVAAEEAEGGVSAPEDPGTDVTTIGSAAEGSEAAETTTWTYDGALGLKLYAFTRVAYFDAGNKILYGYVRLLTFDKYGRLYAAGAESRVSVDVTVLET